MPQDLIQPNLSGAKSPCEGDGHNGCPLGRHVCGCAAEGLADVCLTEFGHTVLSFNINERLWMEVIDVEGGINELHPYRSVMGVSLQHSLSVVKEKASQDAEWHCEREAQSCRAPCSVMAAVKSSITDCNYDLVHRLRCWPVPFVNLQVVVMFGSKVRAANNCHLQL